MERREFVRAAGSVALGVAVAGCSGNLGGGGGETDSFDPAATEAEAQPAATETEIDGRNTPSTEAARLSGSVADDSDDGLTFVAVNLYQTFANSEEGNGETPVADAVFGSAGDGVGVKGALKNVSDVTYSEVEVTATLYDDTDDVLGKWLDNTADESTGTLKPGERWDFDVVFQNADVGEAARYTVSASGDVADS